MEGNYGKGGEGIDYVRKTVDKDAILRRAESFEMQALEWTADNRGASIVLQMKYEGHAEGLREAAQSLRRLVDDGIEPTVGW